MSEEDRERRQSFWTLFFFYKSHLFRVLKKSIQNPKQNTEDAILFFGLVVPKSSRHYFTQSHSTHSLITTTRIKMTAAAENSTRTNAAGEKYSLRGIYGSEPYWPEAKLKICVTGAGGFIGASIVIFFLSFFWVLGDADLSRSFGFFFSSEGLAETPPPPPRVFLAFSKLARLEKERGRKTIKAPSLAVGVVVFSLESQMLEDDDDHPYKNAGR